MTKRKKTMRTEEITKLLGPLAKTFNVAVSELWKIFVRQYVVKGLSQAVSAVLLILFGWIMFSNRVGAENYLWAPAVSWVVGVGLVYQAVQYLGNPAYFALEDLIRKVRGKDGFVSTPFH